HRHGDAWTPQVLTASGEAGLGMSALWDTICAHRDALTARNLLAPLRSAQQVRWMWRMVEAEVMQTFQAHPAVAAQLNTTEAQVRAGYLPPTAAALRLLRA